MKDFWTDKGTENGCCYPSYLDRTHPSIPFHPYQFRGVDDLIRLEHPDPSQRTPKTIVGHNVAYDRSFVREQYSIAADDSQARFVDTMSLHVAVAGFTAEQRALYTANAKGKGSSEVTPAEIHRKINRGSCCLMV